MNEKPNICKQIHMPAQSGNTQVLQSMGRGYSREAYLELVDHVRTIIPSKFKLQYNTVKPKTFKPNLLDEPKDISSQNFLFFIFAFFKTETISELK